jgi:hypothetical protein
MRQDVPPASLAGERLPPAVPDASGRPAEAAPGPDRPLVDLLLPALGLGLPAFAIVVIMALQFLGAATSLAIVRRMIGPLGIWKRPPVE